MIESALSFVKNKLDQNLALQFDLHQNAVVINSLLNIDGSVPKMNRNKMVITLIKLEHDVANRYSAVNRSLNNEVIAQANLPQHFNIDLLFTANFDDYSQALKFLSATINFFQANASFNANNSPDMPEGLSMLNFETKNTNYEDSNNLWSAMGATYRPSVIYKVRDLTIGDGEVNAIQPAINDISTETS